MSSSTPSHALPRYIDLRKFAQRRVKIDGRVSLVDLPRLAELVCSTDACIEVELQFDVGEQGLKVIRGRASGVIDIPCQRCLEPMDYNLDTTINLALVWSEEEARNLPGSQENMEPWIAGEGQSDVYEVVEEELLLCLPMVAYHDYQCVQKTSFGDELAQEEQGKQASKKNPEGRQNPFHMLERLKGKTE